MLVQFTVENFMSFEKETTFSMAASPSDEMHPDHLCPAINDEKGGPLLRAAALYGANASGKSNLIKAIVFARNLIMEGTRFGERLYPQPFRLSDAREKPSRFQFTFRTKGVLYEYGFVLDDERIHEEWLFGTRNAKRAKEQKYFERTTTAEGRTKTEFGNGINIRAEKSKQRLDFVAEGTRVNQLLLSELVDLDFSFAYPAYFWFDGLTIFSPNALGSGISSYLVSQKEMNSKPVLALLKAAGTNINAIVAKKVLVDTDEKSRIKATALLNILSKDSVHHLHQLQDRRISVYLSQLLEKSNESNHSRSGLEKDISVNCGHGLDREAVGNRGTAFATAT